MASLRKVIGFSVPPAIEREVAQIAKAEKRTKSELFREMFRLYKRYRQRQDQEDEAWVMNLIREAQEEQAKNPMSVDDMLKESEELATYGAAQAKKLRIKPKDVNRIIHESRKQWGQA